ncbi:hypothetical protein [Devosia sp.]|uniref:hypothetical protein n=1 Tax=Devosia sp. TaxID=1871048 RepID=UPI003BAC99E8
MKLTWFGGTTLRIYIGGSILVSDPAGISGVATEELVGGADATFEVAAPGPVVDLKGWQPRRAGSVLEDSPLELPRTFLAEGGVVVVDAMGEPPLLLVTGDVPAAGRWGRDAVVVAFGQRAAEAALAALGPRLIAVAGDDADVERTFAALRDRLDGTALVALEKALALEV